jgi:hypothetical protein
MSEYVEEERVVGGIHGKLPHGAGVQLGEERVVYWMCTSDATP